MRALVVALLACACTRSDPPGPGTRAPERPASASAMASSPPKVATPEPSLPAQPAAPEDARVVYPFERVHSPIGSVVLRSLREIAAREPKLRADAFIKVGDSITFSDDSLHCFGRREPDLGAHGDLAETLARFRGEGRRQPFTRQSHAAKIGWSAWQALSGNPSPVDRELRDTRARFALVQYGTNDLEIGSAHYFADSLWNIVDHLTAKGVIPVLFTIPGRGDRKDRDVWVPRYNALVRGIAQSAQVPLVDYHLALSSLPGRGLGRDGIHPTTYLGPRGRDGCALSEEGLRHGYNTRNRLVLEALSRLGRALDTGQPLDDDEPTRSGAGTFSEPLSIDALPYADVLAHDAAEPRDDRYACAGARPAPGPERVYRFRLSEATTVRIQGYDRGGQVDLHLLSNPSPEACVRSAERVITSRLPPGTYFVVADEVSREKKLAPPRSLVVIQAD